MLRVATDRTNFEKVMEEVKQAVNAIACHPRQALVAVGSHCGLLKVWDYQQTKYLVSRIFTEGIQCLSYDPEGILASCPPHLPSTGLPGRRDRVVRVF